MGNQERVILNLKMDFSTRVVYGKEKGMIYFDNSATTKPYPEVIDSYVKVSTEFFGNPSSLHGLGVQSEKLLSQAREQIASLLKVKTSEVLFTSGGTESNNLAVKGTALMHNKRGRHIITTSIEHASISRAMEQLEHYGFDVTYLPVDRNGSIQIEDLEKSIRNDTILVSVMHVNNEVGTIQPIMEIGELLKKFPNILFHVDAVQGVGKVPLDISKSRVDLYSISAHKFHGLKGTGALFIREGVRITPLFSGGNQEWNKRSGTENVAGAVAMAKALRVTIERNEAGIKRMEEIQGILRKGLLEIPGIQIHSSLNYSAPNIMNFSITSIQSETMIHALEQEDIYVSTTSACSSKKKKASKTLIAMGVSYHLAERAIRISLSFDNTKEEAIKFINATKKIVNKIGKVRN